MPEPADSFALIHDQLDDLQSWTDAELKRLNDENAELYQEIETLKHLRPDAIMLTRYAIQNVIQCIIVKDETPSSAQDEMTRQIIRIAVKIGCNSWRGFLSPAEVKKQLTSSIFHTDGDLFWYGQQQGLLGVADTVDNPARTLSAADLKVYMEGLLSLGVVAAVVNDADNATNKPIIKSLVAKLRAAAPTLPLMASCSANVDFKLYNGLFDHVEIQTFHQNDSELKTMLGYPADVFCLDTQDDLSLLNFQSQSAVVSAAVNPRNLSLYAGHDYGGTDYRQMGGSDNGIVPGSKVDVVQHMIANWKAARNIG